MTEEKQIEEMANIYYEAMLKARATIGSMNEGAPKWYAKAFFNAGYRKQEWISVEDRLPEKDGMYLIFSPYTNKEGGIVYCNRFLTKGNTIFPPNSFESISGVTHWMPLPEAPKMKNTEN